MPGNNTNNSNKPTVSNISSQDSSPLVVGLSISQSQPDAAHLLQMARKDGFDYVTTSVPYSAEPRADVTSLESKWWRTSVVGRVPPIVHASGVTKLREFSQRLQAQWEWATHMTLPALILPQISSVIDEQSDVTVAVVEYARILQSALLESNALAQGIQIWISCGLSKESLEQFQLLHLLCHTTLSQHLGMLLVMEALPSVLPNATAVVASQVSLLHQAIGAAHIKAICFPTHVFLTNKRGYPTLAKSHQVIFTEVLRRIGRTIRVLIEGPSVHDRRAIGDEGMGATECLPYLQYIKHMRQRPEASRVLDSPNAAMEEVYLDSLQRPLQPLANHLEFQMYETFEKDAEKYQQYQQAIFLTFREGALGALRTAENAAAPRLVTVLVVGAGRGPLVNCVLQAFQELSQLPEFSPSSAAASAIPIRLKIFAIEKNPSAVIYLQSLARHDPTWRPTNMTSVTVVQADARQLTLSQVGHLHADLIVSELLGSFGDNELSPECLDALMSSEICKPTTLSIPQRYVSYIAPVSSMRLYCEAQSQSSVPYCADAEAIGTSSSPLLSVPMGWIRAMETPYVVRSHAATQTHVEQACWSFSHPASSMQKERTAHLVFASHPTHGTGCGNGYGPMDRTMAGMAASTAATGGPIVLHGLLGTFTAILYNSSGTAVEDSANINNTGDQGANTSSTNQANDDPNSPSSKYPSRVILSTAPSSFTPGLFSWFPLYFPFATPLHVPEGASVHVSLWRRTDDMHRVWYEWCARVIRQGEVLGTTTIHNPQGRSYHVSM